jgi:hypothetical protein
MTPGALAKKMDRKMKRLIEVVEAMTAEVAELKTVSKPIELTAEFDDGGILEEIKATVIELKTMQAETNVILNGLRSEIAELKPKRRGRKPSTD